MDFPGFRFCCSCCQLSCPVELSRAVLTGHQAGSHLVASTGCGQHTELQGKGWQGPRLITADDSSDMAAAAALRAVCLQAQLPSPMHPPWRCCRLIHAVGAWRLDLIFYLGS